MGDGPRALRLVIGQPSREYLPPTSSRVSDVQRRLCVCTTTRRCGVCAEEESAPLKTQRVVGARTACYASEWMEWSGGVEWMSEVSGCKPNGRTNEPTRRTPTTTNCLVQLPPNHFVHSKPSPLHPKPVTPTTEIHGYFANNCKIHVTLSR